MRILLPDEKAKDVLRRKRRRMRSRGFVLLGGTVLATAALYLFPGPRQPRDLYTDVDPLVVASLRQARDGFTVHRIDVGGEIWAYRKAGTRSEAMLLLHGFGGSSDIWWQQMGALEDEYTALSASYSHVKTLDQTVAGLVAMLDAEGLERAHVVGTSLGGYVAQALTQRHPERVTSLVLANTFPPGDWIRGETRMARVLAPLLPTWVLRRNFRQSIHRDVFPAAGQSTLVRDYLIQQSHLMSRADFLTRIRLLASDFVAPDLVELQTPTLIIEADNDPLVPLEAREQLKSKYPRASVVTLADVGHFPYLNRPAQYTNTLDDFFGSFRAPVEGVLGDSISTLDPSPN